MSADSVSPPGSVCWPLNYSGITLIHKCKDFWDRASFLEREEGDSCGMLSGPNSRVRNTSHGVIHRRDSGESDVSAAIASVNQAQKSDRPLQASGSLSNKVFLGGIGTRYV